MALTIYVISLFVTSVIGYPSQVKVFPQSIKECRPGEVIENDCNKCICSTRKVFECTPKKCNTIEIETSCRPDTIYVSDTKTCICNRFGKWPHQDCSNVFQNLPDSDHCEPNTYVTNDCNVCRCGQNGKIDKDRCTKNSCQELKKEARRQLGGGQVYGACSEKSWYSLAPCQFCYCVNENKLVCNTAKSNPKQLELGSYKLNVCGKDLMRDALDLMPQNSNKEVLRHGHRKEETTKSDYLLTTNVEMKSKTAENDLHQAVGPSYVDYDMTDSESKSSESEEDSTAQSRLQEYTAKPSTAIIEYIESIEKNYTDSSNEIPVGKKNEKPKVLAVNTILKSEKDAVQTFSAPANTQTHKKQKLATLVKNPIVEESKEGEFSLPNLDLPGVLNKVFQMALKKSMVSIVEDVECKPGTTTAVSCNVCFCTNDAKMMCTNTKCQ